MNEDTRSNLINVGNDPSKLSHGLSVAWANILFESFEFGFLNFGVKEVFFNFLQTFYIGPY